MTDAHLGFEVQAFGFHDEVLSLGFRVYWECRIAEWMEKSCTTSRRYQ